MIKQYTRVYYRVGQAEPVGVYTGDLPLGDDYEPLGYSKDPTVLSFDVEIETDEVDEGFSLRQKIMRAPDIIAALDVGNGTAELKGAQHPKILGMVHKDCRESAIREEVLADLVATHGSSEVDPLRSRPMAELIRLSKLP